MISEELLKQWDEEDRQADEDIKDFDIRINRMRVVVELKKKFRDRERMRKAKTPHERAWEEFLILKREGYADVF